METYSSFGEVVQFRNNLRVYTSFKTLFPTQFKTNTTHDDILHYLKHYTDPQMEPTKITYEYYLYRLPARHTPIFWDLHEKNFQDFALRYLQKHQPNNKWSDELLTRARDFAISSRSDIDWDGSPLSDPEEQSKKESEMNAYHLSTVLYDWCHPDAEPIRSKLLEKSGNKKPVYSVLVKTTLEAVLSQSESLPKDTRIGYLNLANAHHVGGAYNRDTGSQEEYTVSHCTAMVSLTLHADPPVTQDNPLAIKEYINRTQPNYKGPYPIHYRPQHHIPPGGAYFCKTRVIKSDVDCYMIGNASADLRDNTPYRPAEGDVFPPATANQNPDFARRIKLDLEAICLTALDNHIDCLILGATGCGCFLHPPDYEAVIWKDVLSTYGPYFNHILFAIKDHPNSPNVQAFQDLCHQLNNTTQQTHHL